MTCDLSCASVTVHDVCNAQGRMQYMLLVFTIFEIFTLHFVADSKGNNDIIDVKNCVTGSNGI